MADIRACIAKALSKADGESLHRTEIRVCWSPLDFLQRQYKPIPPLEEMITYTNEGEQVEVSKCGDYINRTWSLSILPALQKAIDNGFPVEVECKSKSLHNLTSYIAVQMGSNFVSKCLMAPPGCLNNLETICPSFSHRPFKKSLLL